MPLYSLDAGRMCYVAGKWCVRERGEVFVAELVWTTMVLLYGSLQEIEVRRYFLEVPPPHRVPAWHCFGEFLRGTPFRAASR